MCENIFWLSIFILERVVPTKKGVFVISKLTAVAFLVGAMNFTPLAHAQDSQIRRMYWAHLETNGKQERSQLANVINLDQLVENSVYSVINENELHIIQKKMPQLLRDFYMVDEQDLARYDNLSGTDEQFPKGDESYTTYAELETELREWAASHPDFVQFFSAGKSLEGRDLWGVRLGPTNLAANAMIPAALFVGNHHAREHLSTEVPLLLGRYLVENYGVDQRVTELLNTRHVYIVPMVNPDGSMYDIVGSNYKIWRKNRRGQGKSVYGVDLNRNYGYQWNTGGSSGDPGSEVYHGETPFSEPETQNVKKLVEGIPNLRVLLTFHTFSELILYPWGYSNNAVTGQDGKVFTTMAQTMAKWNGYTPEQASALYIASGDTCDWAYGERKIFCFTFELSPKNAWGPIGFYPGAKAIAPTFKANLEPALYLIDHAADPYGVLTPKLF